MDGGILSIWLKVCLNRKLRMKQDEFLNYIICTCICTYFYSHANNNYIGF